VWPIFGERIDRSCTVEGSVDLESRTWVVLRVWSFELPGDWMGGIVNKWDPGGARGKVTRLNVVVSSVGGIPIAVMHAGAAVGTQGPFSFRW